MLAEQRPPSTQKYLIIALGGVMLAYLLLNLTTPALFCSQKMPEAGEQPVPGERITAPFMLDGRDVELEARVARQVGDGYFFNIRVRGYLAYDYDTGQAGERAVMFCNLDDDPEPEVIHTQATSRHPFLGAGFFNLNVSGRRFIHHGWDELPLKFQIVYGLYQLRSQLLGGVLKP